MRWADVGVDEPVVAAGRFRPEGTPRFRVPLPRRRRKAEPEEETNLPDPMVLGVTATRLLVVDPGNVFLKPRLVGSWPRSDIEVSAPGARALVVVNHGVGRSLDVIGGRGAAAVIAALQRRG